jgi:PAS domain S-box-containing protein
MYSFYERDQTSLDAIEAAVRAHFHGPVNFSVNYLQNPTFEEKAYRQNLAETIGREFKNSRPDLVLVASEPALRFAVEYRPTMFPGAPIVFWAISSSLAFEKMPGVTGVAAPAGTHETIDLALQLEPDTTSVAVVAGTSQTEQYWLGDVHRELLRHGALREIDVVGSPGAELLERIARLPDHTVMIFLLYPEDLRQPAISNWDVLAAASQRFPVYSIFPSLALDRGGIGGAYYDGLEDATAAGQVAARVLAGESPDSIPVVRLPDLKIKVDARQLQRWHIAQAALPPGALVLHREPNLWQQYKGYIVAAISLILLQAGLIVGLLWQMARRRRSEAELRVTRDRLNMAVTAGTSVGWDVDYTSGRHRWFGDLNTIFGIAGSYFDGRLGNFIETVHPGDRERVRATIEGARVNRAPYAAEFRVVRPDGEVRWLSARGKFYFLPSGEAVRMLGIATDITDRKSAEEAINSLSGQLIRAQEEERRRIAREIHDDYQQRLAVLAIELATLAQDIEEEDADAAARLGDLWSRASQIGTDLHTLSHRLHSSALDSMGLVAALKVLCREFRSYHDIAVALVAEQVPEGLSHDVALCLFRVTQEALQNVRKHSRARRAEVRVQGLRGEIHLAVVDAGVGFDFRKRAAGSGIGLRSMEERLRLVNGRFEVRSRTDGGTLVEAWVPIEIGNDPEAALGEKDSSTPPEQTIA